MPGSYAEYTCVAADNIQPVPPTKSLTVAEIAALPEMLQTTWGALTAGLGVGPGDSVLVHGATSSIGLCALQLARKLGAGRIGGTTRNPGRETLLLSHGADEVFIDNGNIAEKVTASNAGRFNKILELVGTGSLRDSVKCAAAGGIVCMAGIQGGGKRVMEEFSPLTDLPNRVKLCSYAGDNADFLAMPWEDLVRDADDGVFEIPVGTFRLDEIHKVHKILEEGGGGHKMVVVLAEPRHPYTRGSTIGIDVA
jgi:NADPH:quinone reductase-like Zn-dependent oxidoreductase